MKFLGALFAPAVLALGVGSTNGHQTALKTGEYQELLDGLSESERFLAVCNDYYYTTKIGMDSIQSVLTCSSTELKTIGATLNQLYDEVVLLDEALSHITLQTTICTTAKPRTRRALVGDEGDQGHRDLAVTYKYNWSGGGRCNLCSLDSSDRRTLIAEDDLKGQRGDQRKLREAYSVIDFNTAGDGKALTNQNYVKDEWRAAFGMQVSVEDAKGGYAPNGMARIFDSSNPTGDDWDLGTPNQYCPGGGPGRGYGGRPGQLGENCIAQGNILIVQESNKWAADDNVRGGVIAFTFDSPTRVGHLGILDMDQGTSWLEVLTADARTLRLNFTGFGDNSAQLVHVDLLVKKLKVVMTEAGGVTEIGIFRPTTAKEALSPKSRSYIAQKSPLEEYIPYLEFDISYYLTTRINALFGVKAGSCLYGKWAVVDVQIEAVQKMPITSC
jgi:hypothetical protein